MSDLRELRDLYQEVILEHSKKPRNFGELASANHKRKDLIRCAATITPYS